MAKKEPSGKLTVPVEVSGTHYVDVRIEEILEEVTSEQWREIARTIVSTNSDGLRFLLEPFSDLDLVTARTTLSMRAEQNADAAWLRGDAS